jgi:hypothetical protein
MRRQKIRNIKTWMEWVRLGLSALISIGESGEKEESRLVEEEGREKRSSKGTMSELTTHTLLPYLLLTCLPTYLPTLHTTYEVPNTNTRKTPP